MPVITVFSGTFCNDEPVLQAIVEQTKYKLVSDADLTAEASRLSSTPESKIDRSFSARTSVFHKITHERERSIAYLRLVLARLQSHDDMVVNGFVGQLIPRDLSHVLRVCLIADMKSRIATAAAALQVTGQEAAKLIHKQEEDRAAWVQAIANRNDPWDASLYDMVFPTDKVTAGTIAATVGEIIATTVVRRTARSRKAVQDFLLAAEAQVALIQQGHHVSVRADDGNLTLTINKHVLMLSRLESELKSIAGQVTGVKSVTTKVGAGFHQVDIYRKQDFAMPSKILLVDDEREFVQTLSERLLMRDMGSAIAYDGESALEVAREDEPDVMILDLKMPGIDGIEVLRRVKATQPEIEVIILTGHGSEADKAVCMQLGAFAYLQKPVDVEELSSTIKQANEKIQQHRNATKQ
jgi:two-component system, OmpR family, response regulator CpxR